ncbi:unnamed protein product [Rotaria sp. Silwood2]|nr:unnamed protein product [Rotaria sp. Silwood2]CAF3411035.1 unnamed protein product [Rotaria sp. Silwood2]CAF4026978.1 unnamed protein product [Rotaria sp. Silwood2]CAF4318016.1 unnamed protein product [Rotaria sp. Silwood2]
MRLTIVVFYNDLAEYTTAVTIIQPTQTIYEQLLQSQGASALTCPCSKMAIGYESFVRINTSLHQIFTSAFIEDNWITSLTDNNGDWSNSTDSNDFRVQDVSYFTMLRTLCSLFELLVDAAKNASLATSMFSSQILPSEQLFSQVNSDLTWLKNYQTTTVVLSFNLFEL